MAVVVPCLDLQVALFHVVMEVIEDGVCLSVVYVPVGGVDEVCLH